MESSLPTDFVVSTNMTTSVLLPNNEYLINSNDNHLEIFSLIWLDANDNIKDSQDTEQKLRNIINHFKEFQDAKECQQYIEQTSQKRSISTHCEW